MREPAAAPTALSRAVASVEESCVVPGLHWSVNRNALAPSCVAGVIASVPTCFGRSSEKPMKKPLLPPEPATGTTASAATAAATQATRRSTKTPYERTTLTRAPPVRAHKVAEVLPNRHRRLRTRRSRPCRAPRACRQPVRGWSRSRSARSEEHTSELQSHSDLVCRLLLEKKKKKKERSLQAQQQ